MIFYKFSKNVRARLRPYHGKGPGKTPALHRHGQDPRLHAVPGSDRLQYVPDKMEIR